MKFEIENRFEGTVAELERILDDPGLYPKLLSAMPGLQSIEPLDKLEDEKCVKRRVRYTPNTDGKIPAFGRAVVKPAMLGWVEESSYDKAQHCFDYRILPNLPEAWRDRFVAEGRYQLSQAGVEVLRRIEGEIVVRVPLFGRTVEKLLVREVTDNFRAEASAMAGLLRAARAV